MGDMTHIGAKMRDPTDDLGCGQPVFVTSFMATPLAVRATLTALLKRFHDEVSDDVLGRLQLVLAEVLNNVAEHGASEDGSYGPQIHLCVTRHPRGLACAITDDGVSLPANCLSPRSLPQLGTLTEELPEGGFGWFLIQDLTHALCYYREESHNFLAFCVPFTPGAATDSADCPRRKCPDVATDWPDLAAVRRC